MSVDEEAEKRIIRYHTKIYELEKREETRIDNEIPILMNELDHAFGIKKNTLLSRKIATILARHKS